MPARAPSPKEAYAEITLVFSIVAHAVAVGTMIIVPALATEELPEPRRTSEFIIVKPEMPAPPVVRQQRAEVASSTAIPMPLSPPEGIQPEPIVEPPDPGALDFGASPTGVPVGEFVSGGEPVPPHHRRSVSPQKPVRVGGRIEAPTKLVHVNPIFPPNPPRGTQRRAGGLRGGVAEGGYRARREGAASCTAVRGVSHRGGEAVAVLADAAQWRTGADRDDGHSGIYAGTIVTVLSPRS